MHTHLLRLTSVLYFGMTKQLKQATAVYLPASLGFAKRNTRHVEDIFRFLDDDTHPVTD